MQLCPKEVEIGPDIAQCTVPVGRMIPNLLLRNTVLILAILPCREKTK